MVQGLKITNYRPDKILDSSLFLSFREKQWINCMSSIQSNFSWHFNFPSFRLLFLIVCKFLWLQWTWLAIHNYWRSTTSVAMTTTCPGLWAHLVGLQLTVVTTSLVLLLSWDKYRPYQRVEVSVCVGELYNIIMCSSVDILYHRALLSLCLCIVWANEILHAWNIACIVTHACMYTDWV